MHSDRRHFLGCFMIICCPCNAILSPPPPLPRHFVLLITIWDIKTFLGSSPFNLNFYWVVFFPYKYHQYLHCLHEFMYLIISSDTYLKPSGIIVLNVYHYWYNHVIIVNDDSLRCYEISVIMDRINVYKSIWQFDALLPYVSNSQTRTGKISSLGWTIK